MRIRDWSSDVCSSDLAMGTGTVYSVTVIGRKPPAAPYHVALIDLDEGPRLMSRVEGMAAEDVRIGMKVKARVAQEDETPILVFDPRSEEHTSELQSLMRISYAVFCLKKNNKKTIQI